jgi:hypothetical protein
MRTVASRFDVFTPAFYADNIVHASGPISVDWLVATARSLPINRVGSWTLLVGAPAALALMWARGRQRNLVESTLLVSSIIQFVLFVTLLQVKTIDYLIALWPLGALALAWFAVELWNRRTVAARTVLVSIVVGIGVEGAHRLVAVPAEARATSSYDAYEQRIANCIPPASLVVGFQHYWWGLRQFRYRSWLLPLNLANPYVEVDPVPLDVALDRIAPDIILIDRHMRDLLADTADPAHPYHHIATGFEAFRAKRPFKPLCAIQDRSYGTMEVVQVADSARTP